MDLNFTGFLNNYKVLESGGISVYYRSKNFLFQKSTVHKNIIKKYIANYLLLVKIVLYTFSKNIIIYF